MRFRAQPVRLPDCQQNWEQLASLPFDKIVGPFTANSGAIAAGVESHITVAHSLGVVPKSIAFAYLADGNWSSQFGWRAALTSTNVSIYLNNHGPNAGQAILTFYLVA